MNNHSSNLITLKTYRPSTLSAHDDSRKRCFDRTLLPPPFVYYRQQFPGLKTQSVWATVRCCFHDDMHLSLRLHLPSGSFYCSGCGVKGGDVLAFHQQRYRLPFRAAVTALGAWMYEV